MVTVAVFPQCHLMEILPPNGLPGAAELATAGGGAVFPSRDRNARRPARHIPVRPTAADRVMEPVGVAVVAAAAAGRASTRSSHESGNSSAAYDDRQPIERTTKNEQDRDEMATRR